MKTASNHKSNSTGAMVGVGAAIVATGMSKLGTATAANIAPMNNFATVTYIMSINDDGTGHYEANHFAVYASDNTNNGGIASFDVHLGGAATITNYSPMGDYDDGTGTDASDELGFADSLLRTANNNTPVTASQDTVSYATGGPVILVYGFGQTAGNLASDAKAGSTGAAGSTTQAVYGAPLEVIRGTFTGSAPTFTSTVVDTGNVFVTHSGYGTEAPTLAFSTVTIPPGPAHAALLTITASGTAAPAYIGTSNPGATANATTITVVNTGTGSYIPGLLNGIAVGNASNGAVQITGFTGNDAEIIAVAISVSDVGNATLHTPSAQEISDIIADLNANPALPGGTMATVESFNGTVTGTLQYDNPAAYALLNTVESNYSGQPLELAVLVSGTGLTSPQTFGLNFTTENADGMTAVDVTDIAVVPEPVSMSLLLLGGIPMVWRRRRRRD